MWHPKPAEEFIERHRISDSSSTGSRIKHGIMNTASSACRVISHPVKGMIELSGAGGSSSSKSNGGNSASSSSNGGEKKPLLSGNSNKYNSV